jgi:plastocyanin
MRTLHNIFCLAAAIVCTFAACRGRAATVDVDWDFNLGFSPDTVTVNAGDEVDFVNFDDTFDLQITGASPESFFGDAPPTDGFNIYAVPHIYNNPGVFTASDEFANTVRITVNSAVPLAVNITDPSSNAVFIAPATFSVTAVPSGGAAPYLDVQFLVGTNDAGDILSSPFTTTVTNLRAGSYVISAIVTDNNLNTATNSIPVTVVPPPRLAGVLAGGQLIVSWPTNNSGLLTLHSTTNLRAVSWPAAAQPVALVGTNWVVTNPVSGPRMFFRLAGP